MKIRIIRTFVDKENSSADLRIGRNLLNTIRIARLEGNYIISTLSSMKGSFHFLCVFFCCN